MDETVVKKFAAALGRPDQVVTDAATMTEAGRDYWGFGGRPGLLLRPRTREEVIAAVRIAAEHHIPVVPRGAATNCAAAVMGNPDRVMIGLSAFNQVLDIKPTARTARVQTGVINADLQQLAPMGNAFHRTPCLHTYQRSGAAVMSVLPCVTTCLASRSSYPTVKPWPASGVKP